MMLKEKCMKELYELTKKFRYAIDMAKYNGEFTSTSVLRDVIRQIFWQKSTK